MGTGIIVVVLLVIVALAVRSALKHFKGEGGCCGGGGEIKEPKKKISNPIGQKTIHIEGMHCDHCKNSVEHSINKIEGAAARVNLKKKEAVVTFDREVPENELIAAVEAVGFQVVGIE